MIFRNGVKRIQVTFRDEDDTLYDPDSIAIVLYDSEGTAQAPAYTDADCTNPSVGVWYLDYTVPADAEYGQWKALWTATVGANDYVHNYQFDVWNLDWPTPQRVRDYLAGMVDDRVSAVVIELQIPIAVFKVNQHASATAGLEVLIRAWLTASGYFAYLAYATEFERTLGMVPGPILDHLAQLKMIMEQFMGYAAEGVGQTGIGPTRAITPTVVPETYEESGQVS